MDTFGPPTAQTARWKSEWKKISPRRPSAMFRSSGPSLVPRAGISTPFWRLAVTSHDVPVRLRPPEGGAQTSPPRRAGRKDRPPQDRPPAPAGRQALLATPRPLTMAPGRSASPASPTNRFVRRLSPAHLTPDRGTGGTGLRTKDVTWHPVRPKPTRLQVQSTRAEGKNGMCLSSRAVLRCRSAPSKLIPSL